MGPTLLSPPMTVSVGKPLTYLPLTGQLLKLLHLCVLQLHHQQTDCHTLSLQCC